MIAGNNKNNFENYFFLIVFRASRNRLFKTLLNIRFSFSFDDSFINAKLNDKTLCDENLNNELNNEILYGHEIN